MENSSKAPLLFVIIMASDPGTACVNYISQSDVSGLSSLLHTDFDILKFKDSRGYSALHIAALNSNSDVVQLLLDYVQPVFPEDEKQLSLEWINRKTEEDFTALHFAAFRGNLVVPT